MEIDGASKGVTVFKLQQFPRVCRLCLEPESSGMAFMVRIDTDDELLGVSGTIGEFIAGISFEVPESKTDLFPRKICIPCLEMLRFYAKYRSKIMHVHLLMDALTELKYGRTGPLVDLFRNRGEAIQALIRDLALSEKKNPCITDLIYEFKQYDIASMVHDLQVNEAEQNVEMLGTQVELTIEPVLPKSQEKAPKEPFENPKSTHKFPCRFYNCPEGFSSKKDRAIHFEVHKTFVCETCGLKFSKKFLLECHTERHLTQRNFSCRYCHKTFKTKRDLGVHERAIHVPRSTLVCDTCGLEFKHKRALQYHELTHGDAFDHPCQMCDGKFKSVTALRCHVKRVHTERRYGCTECEKKFHSNYLLMDHVERMHGRQMRFYCDVCVEMFTDRDLLAVHRTRHDRPQPLECGTCLVVFDSREQMDANHLCLSYRDSYVCCGKDWRHHNFYNRHMFLAHAVKTNVRVRMQPGQLLGKMRMARKRTEICTQCDQVIKSSRKDQHMEVCAGKMASGK